MKPEERKLLNHLLADERLTDPRWVAYIMATVKHETNRTFLPVQEAYWLSADWRRENLRYWPWHGRGFVQITWKSNYEKLSYRLGIPELATNAELALDWGTAYEILVVGMIEGLFTGHDLDDFINEDHCDYNRARKIVNGMDQHKLIARYAREYEKQIGDLGNWSDHERGIEDRPEPKAPKIPCETYSWEVGDRGYCVTTIQMALNAWAEGAASLQRIFVDGEFGPQTKSRVQRFQRARDLDNDGIVGPKTWLKLEPYL